MRSAFVPVGVFLLVCFLFGLFLSSLFRCFPSFLCCFPVGFSSLQLGERDCRKKGIALRCRTSLMTLLSPSCHAPVLCSFELSFLLILIRILIVIVKCDCHQPADRSGVERTVSVRNRVDRMIIFIQIARWLAVLSPFGCITAHSLVDSYPSKWSTTRTRIQ